MTSSIDRAQLVEREARMYWSVMRTAWERFLADPTDPMLDELCDELDVLGEMTDWPTLARLCRRARELDDKLRQPLLRATG